MRHPPRPQVALARLLMKTLMLLALGSALNGCAVAHLAGAMGQAHEDQKLIEVPAKYPGLENKTFAVVVDADMGILYSHPRVIRQITGGVTLRIGRDVANTKFIPADTVLAWQWRTPQWNTLPYGKVAEQLNVDRLVWVDLQEYRLHPPGNQWLWEGVCHATVSVVEADGFDPDTFYDSFTVVGEFPRVSGITRDAANAAAVETGLLAQFIEETAWLFYEHLEPKHPDRYRPELNARR